MTENDESDRETCMACGDEIFTGDALYQVGISIVNSNPLRIDGKFTGAQKQISGSRGRFCFDCTKFIDVFILGMKAGGKA